MCFYQDHVRTDCEFFEYLNLASFAVQLKNVTLWEIFRIHDYRLPTFSTEIQCSPDDRMVHINDIGVSVYFDRSANLIDFLG